MAQFQSGIHTIGASRTGGLYKEFTITFPEAFNKPPAVVGNTLQDPKWPGHPHDTYAVSWHKVTTTQAHGQVYRVDGGTGWAQNLLLNWVAALT